MRKALVALFVFSLSMLNAQNWKSYYNRIPAWPSVVLEEQVTDFTNQLALLAQEIQDNLPSYDEQFENLSQEEAMKLAIEYQRKVANMSAEEIERISGADQYTANESLERDMEMANRLMKVLEEFDNKLSESVKKLHNEIPCDPGLGETNCDKLSSRLIELSIELSDEYFLGANPKIKSAVDEFNDYLIKTKLPDEIQREKDQMKLMGKNADGNYTGMLMVQSCLEKLQYASIRLENLAELQSDSNIFFFP